MRINNNVAAFNAYRNLSVSQNQLGKSLEKLSSGFRINRASDDASGLVISENLRSQIGGLRQATRNAQDGVSVVQTAEGALTEVHSMLQRMRDLAVQSASTGTYDTTAREAAQAEINQLAAEIDRIAGTTKFGNTKLLDGNFGKTAGTASAFAAGAVGASAAGDDFSVTVTGGSGAVTVDLDANARSGADLASYLESTIKAALVATGNSVDAAAAEDLTVTATAVGGGFAYSVNNSGSADVAIADGTGTALADMGLDALGGATAAAASGTGGVFQVGAGTTASDQIAISISGVATSTLGVDALDLVNDASTAIDSIDSAISSVSDQRGQLGAVQNRFEHTVANLQVSVENLTASESRIRDTDMAAEMTTFTRNQIMQQAGTAMLAQANTLPQSVLSLLR